MERIEKFTKHMLDVLMHFEKFPQQKHKMQPSWIYTFWKFTNIPISVECIHAMHIYWLYLMFLLWKVFKCVYTLIRMSWTFFIVFGHFSIYLYLNLFLETPRDIYTTLYMLFRFFFVS